MTRLILLSVAIAVGLSACSSGDRVAPIAPGAPFKVGKPYTINGVTYVPRIDPNYDETGVASWYGPGFHGRPTASGETYDMDALTAAHPTLPLPSRVRVVNLDNGRSIVLKVNDRGPFAKRRIIDVSRRAAKELGFMRRGTARVRVQVLDSPAFAARHRDGRLYVQAGAFADSRKARRLRARLSPIGSFRIARQRTSAGLLHRVRAGPLRSSAEARELLGDLRDAGYFGAVMTRD